MIRLPPRSTPLYSSAASDVYKRQVVELGLGDPGVLPDPKYLLGDLGAGGLRGEAEREVAVSFLLLGGHALGLLLLWCGGGDQVRRSVEGELHPGVLFSGWPGVRGVGDTC